LRLVGDPSNGQVRFLATSQGLLWSLPQAPVSTGIAQMQGDFQEVSLADNVEPALGEAGVVWPPKNQTMCCVRSRTLRSMLAWAMTRASSSSTRVMRMMGEIVVI
jgi:hypothetical protein